MNLLSLIIIVLPSITIHDLIREYAEKNCPVEWNLIQNGDDDVNKMAWMKVVRLYGEKHVEFINFYPEFSGIATANKAQLWLEKDNNLEKLNNNYNPPPSPEQEMENLLKDFFFWIGKNMPEDFRSLVRNEKNPNMVHWIKVFRAYSGHNEKIWRQDAYVTETAFNKTISLRFAKEWIEKNWQVIQKTFSAYIS